MSNENKPTEEKTVVAEEKTAGKKPSAGKKVLNVIFNIFWAIFGGLAMAIDCIVSGIGACISIIPIFFGIPGIYFRMVGLAFAPAGQKVVLNFKAHPVRNVFYWIFGGLFNALFAYLWGALLCCTVVGIPLGLQQFKFGKYFLAPFGAKVYKNGECIMMDKAEKAALAKKKEEEEKAAEEKAKQDALLQAVTASKKPAHTIDDLPKLKEMLDKGIITQEEYDKAKAEILG